MAVKGKHRRRVTKSTLRRKRSTRRSHKRSSHNRTHRNRRYCMRSMRGGNYETDVTTRTFEGQPTKPLNEFVVAAPGIGTMSGSAYLQLMRDRDRNGTDVYD